MNEERKDEKRGVLKLILIITLVLLVIALLWWTGLIRVEDSQDKQVMSAQQTEYEYEPAEEAQDHDNRAQKDFVVSKAEITCIFYNMYLL